MSRNAEQIREEIEQTRGQLGQTLEAIGDRVSPRHVVEDLAEKVSPRRLVRRQTEKVKEGISNVGDTMKSKANSGVNGSGKVRAVSASAVEQVRAAPENAPLIAGAVAFGAGLAIALAVRPSSRERKVAASVGTGVAPPLRARATRVKESVRADLEPKVKGGVDRVKRSAAGAKARVKAEATGATADIRTDIAEVAREVKKGARNVKSQAGSEVRQKVAARA